jgi:hypothetical protein
VRPDGVCCHPGPQAMTPSGGPRAARLAAAAATGGPARAGAKRPAPPPPGCAPAATAARVECVLWGNLAAVAAATGRAGLARYALEVSFGLSAGT